MSKSSNMDQAIKRVILDAIDADGFDETAETTAEKIAFLRNRFESEAGRNIERKGRQPAMAEWLSGLAINIPYMNYDILQLAKDTGGLAPDATEKQEYKILNNYWNFMAAKTCQLLDGYRVPKDNA